MPIIGTLPVNITNGQPLDAPTVMTLFNYIVTQVNANAEAIDSDAGTVQSVSISTANGFAGTVLNATTNPAISISTTVTGVLKGNGTILAAATGADLPAMTATVGGAVPTPPNNTTTFLRGDGTFAAPPGAGGGTVTSVSVATANGFGGTVATPTSTPAITITTGITGMLKGNGTAISAAVQGVDYVSGAGGDARYVIMESGGTIQNIGTSRVNLSADGTWNSSDAAGVIDAMLKVYTATFVAPAGGYLKAASFGETRFDFNSQGGEAVGGYFVSTGTGTIGGGSVNDVVGVSGTAIKYTNNWMAGGHFDCYDNFAGGTAIGVNVELRSVKAGSSTYGVNIAQVDGTAGVAVGIQFQGSMAALFNAQASATNLMTLSSSNPMFVTRALGTYAGQCLVISVDGGTLRYIPLYTV